MISIAALLYKDKLTLSTQIIKLLNLYSNILKENKKQRNVTHLVLFHD